MKLRVGAPVSQRLKWLPNAITISRALFAAAAFMLVLRNNWAAGFWVLLVALSTDFLDGLAAKKLNAKTDLGEVLDGIVDSAVGLVGILSLGITGHLSWWIVASAFAIGVTIGSDRIFPGQPHWRWRTIVAVASLFVVWIFVAWFYADIAFGWSWLYVPVTATVLVVCGLLKRHRIAAWLHN